VSLLTLPFPLQKNQGVLANCGFFAAVFTVPMLAGLWHLGRISGEGQYYGSPINGLFEANYLATVSCQSMAMLR
jgi:hypothetical protein